MSSCLKRQEPVLFEREIYYGPPAGRMYKGTLIITSGCLFFKTWFDSSAAGLWQDWPCMKWTDEGIQVIRKTDIVLAEMEPERPGSCCRIKLADNSRHFFTGFGSDMQPLIIFLK